MICVSIGTIAFEECFNSVKNIFMAEIRLDKVNFSVPEVTKLFLSHKNLIATCRAESVSEEKRLELLTASIKAGASHVDIELESTDVFKNNIIKLAKKNNSKIIISYHNYEKTPNKRELDQILSWCFDSGAEIAKIACKVTSVKDNARLLSLYDNDKQVIAIGMGELGKITRVVAPILGAPFTYASYEKGKETASGQIDKETLNNLMETLKRV